MRREVGTEARAAGFTIIEVTLFLAISGALVVGLLATVGFAISRQRFTDAVTGTQAFIQSQFSQALNVVNDRSGGSCTVSKGATVTGSGTVGAGQSNCVVLGRALLFNAASPTEVTSYPVVGTVPSATGSASGGQLLAQYQPGIDTSSPDRYDVPWGAQIFKVRQNGTTTAVSRIFLLRSPDSGLILTFADNGSGPALAGALSTTGATYNVCLRSADIISSVSAVSIAPVAGSEGVTTLGDLTQSQQGTTC